MTPVTGVISSMLLGLIVPPRIPYLQTIMETLWHANGRS
jgi:Na+-transporting NADH:ubiquinone oxidoreductase subunit NqrB